MNATALLAEEVFVPNNELAETVLVVEDSLPEQVRMQAMLKNFGYSVVCASNGAEALELAREHAIRLILSDWRMPEMTGIELCRELRQDPAFQQPYIVLVTGQSTGSDLVAAMEAGADDFLAKPFNGEELRVRLLAGKRVLHLRSQAEQQSTELADTLDREAAINRHLLEDRDAAAMLQKAFLSTPSSPFPEVRIASVFDAAEGLGGDTYGFFPIGDGKLAFYMVDSAGRGASAVMLSIAVKQMLTNESRVRHDESNDNDGPTRMTIVPPEEVLAALNRRFTQADAEAYQFSIVYGVVDVKAGVGALSVAGMPTPLISGPHGAVRKIPGEGLPVGSAADSEYTRIRFHIELGECLYLFSDGVLEATGIEGENDGIRGLARILHDNCQCGGAEKLADILGGRRGDTKPTDDVALLAIERVTKSA